MHIDVIQVKGENVTIAIPTDRMIVFFLFVLFISTLYHRMQHECILRAFLLPIEHFDYFYQSSYHTHTCTYIRTYDTLNK